MLPAISVDFFILRHRTFINSHNFKNRVRFNLKLVAFQSLEISLSLKGHLEFSGHFYLPLPRTKIRLKNKIYGLGGDGGGGPLGEATLLQTTKGPVEVLSNTQTLNVSFRLLGKNKIQPARSAKREKRQQFYQGVPTEPQTPPQPRSARFWTLEDWAVGLLLSSLFAFGFGAWIFRLRKKSRYPNLDKLRIDISKIQVRD